MAHVKKRHAPLPPAAAVVATHRVTNGSEKPIRATSHGRDLELSVVLPGGVLSSITVDYSTAMADVLVLIAAKHKLTPSEHVLSVLSEETGHQLSYTSLQTIGSLQVKRVYLLSRKTPKKEEPTGVATVVVSLPRGRRTSYDFAAKTSIAHAYRVVCADKGIDPSSHSILLPGADSAQPPTELTSTTLGESGIDGFSILPNKSPSRYHSMMDVSSQSNGLHRGQSMAEKKARSSGSGGGFFAFFRRKKKSKEQSSDSNSSRSHDADPPAGAADVTLSNSSGSSLPTMPPALAGAAVSDATTVAAKPPKPQASVKPQVHVPAASYRSETDGGGATEFADQHTPSSSSSSKSRKKQHAPQPPSLRSDGSSGASSAGGSSGATGDRPPSPPVEPPPPAAVIHEHISRVDASSFEAVTVQHGYQPSDQTAAAPIALVPALQSPVDGSVQTSAATGGGAMVACDDHGEAVSTAVQNSAVHEYHSSAAAASGSHGKKSRAPPPPSTNSDRHSSGEIYHAECELGFANPSAASACASAPTTASIATAAAVTAPAASGSSLSWPVFIAPPPPKYPPPPNSPLLSGGGDAGSHSSSISRGGGSCCSSPGSVHRELLCAGLQATVTDLQGSCGAVFPGLDSHAAEILRSASRNSEASVDTIADVTRSFEQAIVEGQNALKEQWQDLQPRIADFVASMDVLTEDLQQSTSSSSRTAPVAARGALDGHHLAAAGLPTHAESQYLQPTTDDMQQLASGGDSETTASSASDASSVVPKSQALTSSLSSPLPRDNASVDAALTSAPRRTAVSSSAQADGAGDWSTAVGSGTSPAGDELIVGGDEPRHPFVSDRVWQDLTDRRRPPALADEVEAQRLLRLLTTAALPSDDPVGSVRGVKGGVRATRSRLFADDDRSVDRDDESSEVADVEPMVTPRLAGVVTAAAAVGTAAAPAAVEAREPDRKFATVEVAATTMPKVDAAALPKMYPLSTQVGTGAPSASMPVMSRDAIGLPPTSCSATAAAAVDAVPIAASGLSVGVNPAPTDVVGATVVRARPAVVSQPAALDQTDEAKRRSLLVLAASSTAAPRPDLNDVPMPAKVSTRSEGVVGTGFKDETEVKLRAVAGRSSISSSTTQLFSRRSQPPIVQAPVAAASTQPAAAAEAAVAAAAEAAVASPSAASYGGSRPPSVQSPNDAQPNRPSAATTSASGAAAGITVGTTAAARAAAAGQLGPLASSTSTGLGQRTNIVIIEAAGDDRQKVGDDVQPGSAKKPTSSSMPAAANPSLPPIGSAGSRAAELRSANRPDGDGRAHAVQRDAAASTYETDMPHSTVQHASAEESAQTGFVVEPVTTAAASVRRTRGTGIDVPRPAGPAAWSPSSADAPIVAASADTQVTATRVRLPTTDANIESATAALDRSDVATVSAPSLLLREDSESKVSSDKSTDRRTGDGNARAQIGLEAAAATALPGVSVRAGVSGNNTPPSNHPRKTIFSLLSSLDSKPPIVKKRSSTLPLADEPTTEREDPSDALKERSGSVVDRPVRRTAAGGIYASDAIPAAAAVEPLGRPSAATLATAEPPASREAAVQKASATPLAAKLPSSAQPLQARLFSPRPFVTRQPSAGAEETGSFVATVRPSAAAEALSAPTSERRLSTATSAPSALSPGNEQAQPKEQPHAFRLSVSASPADAEARRKQELVRRYQDLQKDVAAWRGQLAQNEAVIRDVTTRPQRHSAGPLMASQSSGEKVFAAADTPTASLATAAATTATSTSESVAAGSGTVLRATASAPRPRMAASLPRASDSQITLESMVAQMTQVKLKPATERAAKNSSQQQQPPLKSSDSRELLLQSIRDRGERLKLVEVNDSKAEPAQPKLPQQHKKPSEVGGDGGSQRAQLSGSGSASSLSQSTSSSSLSSLPAPPVPPPLPPTALSLASQPQPSNTSKRTSAVLKAPSQSLDPREELMIAIRSFGAAMKLRTATSSPAATPR